MQFQVSNRAIGSITFDAVTEESHSSELAISENPVESGALIADHAVVKPKEIIITGVMVDHDHSSTPLAQVGIPHIRGISDFLDSVPLPSAVVNHTAQTIAKANRLLSQAKDLAQKVDNALSGARAIAPWLPDFSLGGMLDSTGGNRVQKCYADLLAVQKSGQTIDIQTGFHLYQNMLITAIAVRQSQDGSAEFSITAKEIFIVETESVATNGANTGGGKRFRQSVQGNSAKTSGQNSGKNSKNGKGRDTVSGKNKSGRAGKQGKGKSQKGNVQLRAGTPPSLDFGFGSGGSSGSAGNGKHRSILAKVFN